MKESAGIRGAAQEKVTSLGFKIPRNSGSLGYLVINVKTSSLRSYIGQAVDYSITEAELYDAAGRAFSGRRRRFRGRTD